jgi:Mg-chelatase subunit ChlD
MKINFYARNCSGASMHKSIIVLLIFLSMQNLSAQNKMKYDIVAQKQQNGLSKITGDLREAKAGSEWIEMTLISGGYFTVGTTKGISDKKLDDNCQITFGHPYALTSYALFGIDGNWYKPDDYFSDPSASLPIKSDNELKINSTESGLFDQEFSMQILQDGKSIKLTQKIKNLDNVSHYFGLGLVFDPALGHWGDGYLKIPGGFLVQDTSFTSQSISDLSIWEKAVGAKGIGIGLMVKGGTKVIAGNWNDVYANSKPEFSNSALRKIYDLDLKFYSEEEQLSPGGEITFEVILKLLEPDFSSKIFTRWDLPYFIAIDNGLMFPSNMETYIELSNTSASVLNGNILLDLPSSLTTSVKEYSVSVSNNPETKKILLYSNITYEDKIVEVKAMIKENNQIVDEFHRNVFIPATPVSDSGLVILEDSLITSEFPIIELLFSVEKETTHQRIKNLQIEDIFLWENGKRIETFQLGKYTGGGSNLADVVFVLDISGSMGDNIQKVVNNLIEFGDSMVVNGFDYQIGVVTFSTTVDNVWDFTKDIGLIKQRLSNYPLWGGEEDSPAGLYRASLLSFRPGSRRTIIWITDENYTEITYTKRQIVDRMLSMDITVHGVGLEELKADWFDPILIPTGGNFYDINGNFRDILLDVTRYKSQDKYLLSFNSGLENISFGELKIEIHYAGLGVIKTYNYNYHNNISVSNASLKYFPNPFNPSITFLVDNNDHSKGNIQIYNVLGQRIKAFSIEENRIQKIVWNARNDLGNEVSAGFYVVHLSLTDHKNNTRIETAKILYLK